MYSVSYLEKGRGPASAGSRKDGKCLFLGFICSFLFFCLNFVFRGSGEECARELHILCFRIYGRFNPSPGHDVNPTATPSFAGLVGYNSLVYYTDILCSTLYTCTL